ncbi:hypothetical protein [Peribacillus sp. NPDC058075]|uniref:hypothetical protein n=1 Tax=unclassified Peribacillus TaxID=2675266 RepID=UPI0036DA8226
MNKFKDPAITILILTVVSYGLVYVYQRGYKSYYKLPETFIEIDTNTMTSYLFSAFVLFILLAATWEWTKVAYFLLVRLRPIERFVQSEYINAFRRVSTPFAVFITVIILMIAASSVLGQYTASNTEEYMVIKEKEHLFVVITSYKDSLIIAPLDLEKESITPTFKAIETKELKDAETIHFENGLKVKDMRNSKDLTE